MLMNTHRPAKPAAAHAAPGGVVTPDKDAIALLEPFERIGLARIHVVADAPAAAAALQGLRAEPVLGFDTESRPTFHKGEASDGPHIVQLATLERAWIFQLHDPASRTAAASLLADGRVLKVGFGLGDDRKRIASKLGVDAQGVIDLNAVFRQQGYRKEIGVRAAVAALFQRRFLKSGKAATSNWANQSLTDAQLLYAANDAWAALRVHLALAGLAAATGDDDGGRADTR